MAPKMLAFPVLLAVFIPGCISASYLFAVTAFELVVEESSCYRYNYCTIILALKHVISLRQHVRKMSPVSK